MKITVRIKAIKPDGEGVSQKTGLPWRRVLVLCEKPGSMTETVFFQVLDTSEGFTRLKRMDMHVGDIKTMFFHFMASEYEGKHYNNIRAYDCVPATEDELYKEQ